MDSSPKICPDAKPRLFSFPNGALKSHNYRPLPGPADVAADFPYRECLKNHAASLGGHALDGCGEFMPSPAANPADPTSLKCAACGCHRNFHRRLPESIFLHHPDDGGYQEGGDEMDGGHDEDHDDGRDEEENGEADCRRRNSASSPPYSAPHMLLALSSGLQGGPSQARAMEPHTAAVAAPALPRKRFRTKFSPEQKERMHEFSERLGWRLQKKDKGLVEEWCREIGVGKRVFKVWMHNNKHAFLGLARRGEAGGGNGGGDSGGVVGGGGSCGDGGDGRVIEESGNDSGGRNSHVSSSC